MSQPILVTGAHRTGTTWVGKMLTASREAAYISEPLNVMHRPGVLRVPVSKWYTFINEENESTFLPAFLELLDLRYGVWREIRSLRSAKDVARMGRDLSGFLYGRLSGQRALIKDPFAVFSAPWFAERLNCHVVVTTRHPAGFASSLKRLNWSFDFKDLLDQPTLMYDLLEDDRAAMESVSREDTLGQAAVLWRIIYRIVAQMIDKYPSFIMVRHENLSLDPVNGFRALYKKLDLNFTGKAEQTILKASSSENPDELSKKKVHSVKLDSRANIDNWKKRLSAEEIRRIRVITEGITELYYPDAVWN